MTILILLLFTVTPAVEGEEIPGLGQYDDFQTIDWQRDLARDRMRHRYIIKHKKDSFWDLIKAAHDAWSGWLCVFLVGLAAGTVASIVDIGTTWMTDLKYGICPDAFWLDREQCCWSSNQTAFGGNCSQVFYIIFFMISVFLCLHLVFLSSGSLGPSWLAFRTREQAATSSHTFLTSCGP